MSLRNFGNFQQARKKTEEGVETEDIYTTSNDVMFRGAERAPHAIRTQLLIITTN